MARLRNVESDRLEQLVSGIRFWNSEYFFVEQADVYDTDDTPVMIDNGKGKKFVQYEKLACVKYCCSFRYGNYAPDHDIGK